MEGDWEGKQDSGGGDSRQPSKLLSLHLRKGPDLPRFVEHHFLYSHVNIEELICVSMRSQDCLDTTSCFITMVMLCTCTRS